MRLAEPAGEPGAGAFQDVDLVASFGEGVVLARVDHQLVIGAEVRAAPDSVGEPHRENCVMRITCVMCKLVVTLMPWTT
jgi:hypothetical protein